jgi:hypothetical protein
MLFNEKHSSLLTDKKKFNGIVNREIMEETKKAGSSPIWTKNEIKQVKKFIAYKTL